MLLRLKKGSKALCRIECETKNDVEQNENKNKQRKTKLSLTSKFGGVTAETASLYTSVGVYEHDGFRICVLQYFC